MRRLHFVVTILISFILSSCADEPSSTAEHNIDRHQAMQLAISSIEYDLYVDDRVKASTHVEIWAHLLNTCDTEYCMEDEMQVQALVRNIAAYHRTVTGGSQELALERLRMLKAQFMNLNTTDNVETYLYDVWRYEEEMYYATKAAMDPMLDLYDWGEFEAMVICLNQLWDRVRRHYPSQQLLHNDQLAYRIQTVAKAELLQSMKKFNDAVSDEDYHTDQLSESASSLRSSYIGYLMTIVSYEYEMKGSFLVGL